MRAGRRGVVLRLLVVLMAVLTSTACRHDPPEPPDRLVDGSAAAAPAVELKRIAATAIAGRIEVVAAADVPDGSATATCLDLVGADTRVGPVVTRTGVDGESVTFRTASGRGLHACDGTGPRTGGDRWCGSAYGRFDDGRLNDPRLDLSCTTATDEPVAFAWVQPAENARFVVVRKSGFVEVYEVSSNLPVRIATTNGLELEESSATFEISEHDARGAPLRSYTLPARVAG
jgi:hypothetical protein